VERMGANVIWNSISVEKHERKIQFERHTREWEGNIRVYLEAVWCDWIGLICGLL
jgi:hypothetical protein